MSAATERARVGIAVAMLAGCAGRPPHAAEQSPRATETSRAAPCPCDMTLVDMKGQRFCIDRYEASLERLDANGHSSPWPGNRRVDGIEAEMRAVSQPGEKPQGYISGVQAELACERAKKRLCDSEEWLAACRGPRDTLYPYGNERRAGVCNDRFKTLDHHPVVRLYKENTPPGSDPNVMWLPRWMNDPRLHELPDTVTPTGSFPECTNEYGAFDMVGNLHEWVSDEEGTFRGGFFMDTFQNGEGCAYRTTGHPFEYHDYSTGFRCCSAPRASESRPRAGESRSSESTDGEQNCPSASLARQ